MRKWQLEQSITLAGCWLIAVIGARAFMTSRSLWALLILFALVWFVNLGSRRLAEPDEGRYAEIPREMLASGDWITPRLNGLKYFEKPILQYWATALAYRSFGVNEASARLYATSLAFLTIPLLFWLGRRLYGEPTGLLAALLLGSSLMWSALGHVNTLDIALGFWLTLALAAFLISQQSAALATNRRRWMWLAWAAIAAATLQKGLVAIALPGAAIAVYAIIQRDFRLLRRIYMLDGVAIVVLVAGPWFWLVSQHNPEFAQFFFVHEHFTRFLTTVHQRDEPWWYFLPWLLLGVLPWIVPIWHGLLAGWRGAAPEFHSTRMLVIWPAVTLVFFSASGSKLAPYIVPMFPPLALLGARWLAHSDGARIRRAILPVAIMIASLLVLVGAAAWLTDRPDIAPYREAIPFLLLAGGTLLLGSGLSAWRLNRGQLAGAVAVLAFAALAAVQLLFGGFNSPSVQRSSKIYAEVIEAQRRPDAEIFFVGGYWQSLPFYLQRTGRLALFQGELQFGSEQEPAKYLRDLPTFASAWRASRHPIAIVNPQVFPAVQAAAGPLQVLFRDRRAVIIAAP